MRNVFAVVAVCFALCAGVRGQDYALPGPYWPAWRSVTVTRANSTTFTARLYYPGSAAGQNANLNASGAPYPAVSFGHGFLQTVDRYQSTLEHLASWGILVIASDSEGGLFPNHANFALDMRQCLTYLEQQNGTVGAFLYQSVATSRLGMSGHSMGGGCSILATAADGRVRALANLAAAETNPSATAQMASITVPVALISGSSDTIVPVGSNGQLMYNAGRPPKLLPVIQGGWHCGFEDVSTFGCDSGPMARADQLLLTRRLLASFFRLYLGGDQAAWNQVWGPLRGSDPRLVTTAAAGMSIDPVMVSTGGFQNRSLPIEFTVTNTGPAPTSYTVVTEDAQWPVTVEPAQTPVIAPSAGHSVAAAISVPAGFLPAAESFLVTLRSDLDGGTRIYASIAANRWCYADLDRTGSLTPNDFQTFINAFATLNPDADADGSGVLTANDFLAFLNAFAGGC